ncbi:hypothetical protein [Kineosporia babensis]|uniref:Uncharacterized protein n=1 Tax=Kineosporia babensis TaxID=499548 RepID=A0A9X1NMM2_9ACTN|nr:hypothetical protein [Kineosporia babensis]MCD5316880.1 hypothetical protein [Kineosporia babensis]
MADETYISSPVHCDTHPVKHPDGPAVNAAYDARTVQGFWAYLCESCFSEWGIGLGTGKGQRLIIGEKPKPDPQRTRTQIHALLEAGEWGMAEELAGEEGLDKYL